MPASWTTLADISWIYLDNLLMMHSHDFTKANEYLRHNPANTGHCIPTAMVSSCSECCMETINGRPNVLGQLFRKSREGKGCWQCPVLLAADQLPARKADGTILTDHAGNPISESDIIRIENDSET